ncbi:Acetyltransferase GNAT family protein [Halorhabdus tiamatea SARL4B]|uniref:Acetyltransferase GNAT family protein n=1 Tax=Halorhabdus tiamatea SARL4B TaxID=1033806 RepID=U2DGP4_9EURY|nr:hypothetical protein [Halorhabdus tiamatea]ERJ05187.1 Acetyltransferase GNAT family protein [Halorhabdus tiamatea SARL4B]
MEILELIDESDREEAIPILKQLWTDRKRGEIRTWTAEDDYHLFGASEDSTLLGVAGVRIDDFLHHQRHAWLYDFASTSHDAGRHRESAARTRRVVGRQAGL